MSPKAVPVMPAAALELYRALVAAVPDAELKGSSLPYTSVNGHMYSFLDKAGACAIRLGMADLEAFLAEFRAANYVHESGVVMRDYVPLPPAVLADTAKAATWLARSLGHVAKLKPKPTRRKAA
jgi:hypothetical protein